MPNDRQPAWRHPGPWTLILLVLTLLRLPALVEPAGNDQSVYTYVAERVTAGGVPYVDAWDQKPPAIFFVYAALWRVWPRPSVVAIADILAAALTAWLLIVLARRLGHSRIGYIAAALFLLFSHPSFMRLSGVYVRGQCEAFIALAVTAALVCVAGRPRSHHLVLAGLWLGVAFWLKYNALAYALPLLTALSIRWMADRDTWSRAARELALVAGGFALVTLATLSYFAAHHALEALKLATWDYNVLYSGQTYSRGVSSALGYLIRMPIGRVRTDILWFLGACGLVLALAGSSWRKAVLPLAWVVAAILSIVVNGARDLPQYFIQATPALALAAAIGAGAAWKRGRPWQLAVILCVLVGIWRVGDEEPRAGFRWAGIPEFASNVAFDLRYAAGRIDRTTFLERFKGVQKYDAVAIDDLSTEVRQTTTPADTVLVFGFAPSVYVQSQRLSASRFFWSRPVVIEFAADHPGYGSKGLAADLLQSKPAIVALEKQDWGPMEPDSEPFFLRTPVLGTWLRSNYVLERENDIFSIWRRKS
jgi:hypothetical protein